jgi:hypothetical protein
MAGVGEVGVAFGAHSGKPAVLMERKAWSERKDRCESSREGLIFFVSYRHWTGEVATSRLSLIARPILNIAKYTVKDQFVPLLVRFLLQHTLSEARRRLKLRPALPV